MRYIQRKGREPGGYLETVDQAETMQEARQLLKEYRIADSTGYYYISQRACRDWANR